MSYRGVFPRITLIMWGTKRRRKDKDMDMSLFSNKSQSSFEGILLRLGFFLDLDFFKLLERAEKGSP